MNKNTGKKFRMGLAAAGVIAAIFFVFLVFDETTAKAKDTLEGIKEILRENTQNSPFLILEVVPDDAEYTETIGGETREYKLSMGQFGYLAEGQEPVQFAEQLVSFPDSQSRMVFVKRMQDSLQEITTVSGSSLERPLRIVDYEEAYSLSQNALDAAEAEGNAWTLIPYEEPHEEAVSGNKVVSALNGAYVMRYSPEKETAEADIVKDLDGLGPDQALAAVDDFTGEFDPHFIADDNGDYNPVFVKTEAQRGFQALEYLTVTSENKGDFKDDTRLYTRDQTDDHFVYAKTLAEAADDFAAEGTNASGKKKTTALDGEEDETRTGAAAEFFVVRFGYSEEKSNEYIYAPSRVERTSNASVTYKLDASAPFVPDYANAGMIKNTGARPQDFVYEYAQDADGNFYGNTGLLPAGEGESASPVRLSDVKVYFRGGLKNNNWFLKYVFDRDYGEDGELLENAYINVETVKASELANYELSQIGLLCFSDTKGRFLPAQKNGLSVSFDTYSLDNDITTRVMMRILGAVVENDLPVIMDRALMDEAEYNGTNIQKLAKLLQQEDVSTFYNRHASKEPAQIDALEIPEKYFRDGEDMKHHVNKSVYMFSAGTNAIVNSDFCKVFDSDEGFEEIIQEIMNERGYREAEGLDPESLSLDLSEAVAIKYIINYHGRQSAYTKEELNILELEPCAVPEGKVDDGKFSHTGFDHTCTGSGHLYADSSDGMWKLYREGNTEPILETASKITITSMSSSEFAGHSEDINSEYDLVYIGMNTAYLNTSERTVDGKKEYRTVYNDGSMNGLVYCNVGDVSIGKGTLSGLLNNYNFDQNEEMRYSGNDLSDTKRRELLDYLKAGYPMIADYNCFTDGYVDSSSQMHDFLEEARKEYGDKNFIRLNQNGLVGSGNSMLSWYLNLAKPEIEIDTSVSLTESNQPAYEEPAGSGNYYLKYSFSIVNKGSTNPGNDFDCVLYTDQNSDGKYSPTTEVESIEIRNISGDTEQKSEGAYHLKAGKTYNVSFPVPDEYSGPIPWKLEVRQNDKSSRRDSVTGCYTMFRPGEIVDVNVLQILPSERTDDSHFQSGETWNWWEWYRDGGHLSGGDVVDFKGSIDALSYHYKFHFRSITADKFIELANGVDDQAGLTQAQLDTLAHEEGDLNVDLDTCNLLVLGFSYKYLMPEDVPGWETAESYLTNYISAGKSVLVTTDVVSTSNTRTEQASQWHPYGHWNFNLTQDLRDLIGMDRYGITLSSEEREEKDAAYTPDSDSRDYRIQGFSIPVMEAFQNHQQTRLGTDYYSTISKGYGYSMTTSGTVKKMNHGQLTMYPYLLKNQYGVEETAPGYYQLDLDDDADEDGESDINIWYAYKNGNNTLKNNSMDARSLYYIYNKGNITYYGMRMSPYYDGGTYLVINTMVASYEAGVKPPTVKIIENSNISSREIDNIHIPYEKLTDPESLEGAYQDIYFYAMKPIKSDRMVADFYYEVPAAEADLSKEINGVTVYLKQLDVSTARVTDAQSGTPLPVVTLQTTADSSVTGHEITGSNVYRLELPLSATAGRNSTKVYVEVTGVSRKNMNLAPTFVTAHDSVNLVKTQLFNLD